MTQPLLIGIDIGTTSVKAALHGPDGQSLKRFSRSYPTRRRPPDGAEQDPADWMNLVLAALGELADGIQPGRIAAIGLCSQVNTHVFVDGDGRPLHPALTWQDVRCRDEASRLDAAISMDDRIGWWGAPLPVDASHVLARMAWMKARHPDLWAKTRHVLAPKDYCILTLTGQAIADPLASFGIVDRTLSLIPSLIGLVEGASERLPPIAGLMHRAGTIRAGLPLAGTPVINGTMDAWSGLFGTGAVHEGQAMYLSGTSEILGIVSPRSVPTPGVIAFPKCEGIVLHAGPTQAGGAAVAWMGRLLGRSVEEISTLAGSLPQDAQVPLFLPHLQGERAPIWDPVSRACFAGMDLSTGPAELSRSVLEGVAYAVRWLAETLETSADCQVGEYRSAGGGMASDVWCQIRADVLGRPINRLASLDAGVLGAAMMAGVGTGLFPSLGDAADALVRSDRHFEPDPAQALRHADRFGLYKELYSQISPINRGLGEIGSARPA